MIFHKWYHDVYLDTLMSCALLECVHDVQTWWFTSISPDLLSAQLVRTAQDVWSHNFFSRHTAFWHKFNEKLLLVGMYVLTWWFTFKCACVMSAHVVRTAQDVWSLNFFSRHTAIWHKFNEKYCWLAWCADFHFSLNFSRSVECPCGQDCPRCLKS